MKAAWRHAPRWTCCAEQRPDNPEQASVYDKVLHLPGQTAVDAWMAAKDVALRQQLDALGDALPSIRASDPRRADALAQQHRVAVMALFNREVYVDGGMPELLPRGWSRVDDAQGLARANLSADMLADPHSGYRAVLYRNQAEGTYVYANRGTDEGQDWTHNLLQAVGETSSQYERALRNSRLIARSAVARNVTFTGHSLGGGLASAQAFSTGMAGMTFNAAGLNPLTVGALGAARMTQHPGLVSAYRVKGELLSTLQDDGPKAAAVTLAALGAPLAGLAAFAALSKLPQAAGQRISMDAVANPNYRGGSWHAGPPCIATAPGMALD